MVCVCLCGVLGWFDQKIIIMFGEWRGTEHELRNSDIQLDSRLFHFIVFIRVVYMLWISPSLWDCQNKCYFVFPFTFL